MSLTGSQRTKIKELAAGFDMESLKEMNDLVVREIKEKRRASNRVASAEYRIGDKVEFANKRGALVAGPIEKINRNTLGIDVNGIHWRVPFSMVKKVG